MTKLKTRAELKRMHLEDIRRQIEESRRPHSRIYGRWGLVWRKVFVAGAILEGINVWDRLEFVDRWHCAQWLKGVRRNIRSGKLEWRFSGRPTSALVLRMEEIAQ